MSKIHTHNVGGIWITKNQEQILGAFAGTYHSDRGRTEWTVTDRGGVSWGYDNNRSSTEPVFRALAKRGVFTVTEDEYTPKGWGHPVKRETFTLVPAVAEHYAAIRARSAADFRARDAVRQAEQDRRDAERAAERRDQSARAMAFDALVRAHEGEYADLLQAAYKSLDTTAAAVAAGESIKSFQESK